MTYEELIELGEKIGHVSKGLSKEKINNLMRYEQSPSEL